MPTRNIIGGEAAFSKAQGCPELYYGNLCRE